MSTTSAPQRPTTVSVSDGEANHTRRWWILAVLGIAQLMVILDNTIVNIALPTAQHALAFSNADRQWIVTAYSLAFGSLLLLGGRIGDIIGRKRALLIALVGFAGASALGGASVSFPMLVIARSVQGAFGALLAPSVLALLTTTFTDPTERGKAFGIYGGIAGAGGALGLLLGGILTSYASWRWTLFVNLVFAGHRRRRRTAVAEERQGRRPRSARLPRVVAWSPVGCSASSSASPMPRPRPGATRTPSGSSSSASCCWPSSPSSRPGCPTRSCRPGWCGTGRAAARCWPCCSPASGSSASSSSSPTTSRTPLGFSPVKTGFAFLPMVAALATTAQVSNRVLLPRVGPRIIIPIGLLIDAVAMYLLHLVGLHSSYVSHVLPFIILLGVGFGLSLAPSFSTGTLGLRPHDAGVGSAALNTSQQVGGSIGTALLNTLAAGAATAYLVGRAASPANLKAAALHSYTTAFLWSSLIFVVGAVIAAAVLRWGNLGALARAPEEAQPAAQPA